MKKFVPLAMAVLSFAAAGHAAVSVVGQGNGKRFDSTSFPKTMKANYEVMKAKCVRCHTLERVVEAITTGVSPISGAPFDHSAVRAYGAKMIRKPEAHMSKQEVAATMDLMDYLLDENTK